MRPGGTRAEAAYTAFILALLWIVMLGIMPMIAAMIVGMAQGTIEKDVTTASPGYPAFPVLSTGMAVPALVLAFVLVRTFTWPLKDLSSVGRSDIAWLSLVGLSVLLAGSSLEMDSLPEWAARINAYAMLLFLAVFALALARIAAGALRLVPRSWHEEPAKPTRKRAP